jgi:hypothetical protein
MRMFRKAAIADSTHAFETSARKDIRWWGLLLVGITFWWAGTTLRPEDNCDDSGECAPWLVPLAAGAGLMALTLGGAMLIANPRRGSRVDPVAGVLHWWTWRRGPRQAAKKGQIPLAEISRIRVVNTSDNDFIYFYGQDGDLLPLPEAEAFPWPYQDWAGRLVAAYPHITLVIVGD